MVCGIEAAIPIEVTVRNTRNKNPQEVTNNIDLRENLDLVEERRSDALI